MYVPILGYPRFLSALLLCVFRDEFGVTEFEAPEAAPVPTALVAVTVNVYPVPLTKLPTVRGLADPDPVKLPGFDVAV